MWATYEREHHGYLNFDRPTCTRNTMGNRVNVWRRLREWYQKHSEIVWLTGICALSTPLQVLNLFRTSPYALSRKWGVYYVVGLVMKCYFRVSLFGISINPHKFYHKHRLNEYLCPKISCGLSMPMTFHRSQNSLDPTKYAWFLPLCVHKGWNLLTKVTYRYYLGMLSFLNEEYAKVRFLLFNQVIACLFHDFSLNKN